MNEVSNRNGKYNLKNISLLSINVVIQAYSKLIEKNNMEKHSPNSPFRVIAVKPHKKCLKRYSKILSSAFYIFYDDYEVIKGKLVKKKGDVLKKVEVPLNFYSEDDISVSISAIIGKNGDGKSTIVELIMRILNNFAYATGFTDNQYSLKKLKYYGTSSIG